jgi:hypothetical protein
MRRDFEQWFADEQHENVPLRDLPFEIEYGKPSEQEARDIWLYEYWSPKVAKKELKESQ